MGDRKLHLGCFDQRAPGWINTDITPHLFIARIPGAATLLFVAGMIPRARYAQHKRGIFDDVRYLDIRRRFTLEDDSVSCVYSSHVLEHLYRDDAIRCISEIHRVLRPGGIVRVAVPDLDSLIRRYDPLRADEFAHGVFESRSRRAKNEHHWMYNFTSLSSLLSDAGFLNIRQCGFREGACPDLATVEVRADSLFVEGRKASRETNQAAGPDTRAKHPAASATVLQTRIDFLEPDALVESILAWHRSGKTEYVVFTNPHSLISAANDPSHRTAVENSALTLPDGVGITMAARILGYGRRKRVPGPGTMLHVCDRARHLRHFLYGGTTEAVEELANRLRARFPGLQVAGHCSPPFRDLSAAEDAALVQTINASRADIVWVGLGTGKQEKWMAGHVGRIHATALIGVGAAFDFHAGRVPWAPAWIRNTGLEWIFRLLHEPRRLWRRNLDSPRFLFEVLKQRLLSSRHQ